MIDTLHLILQFARIAALLYLLLMLLYMAGWQRIRRQVCRHDETYPMLSIVIAMRNEAANLECLIKALASQTYPAEKMQIVLVDDHSTDQSALIARQTAQSAGLRNVLVMDSEGKGKKSALRTALQHVQGEWVLFTDADCVPHAAWAETMMTAAAEQQKLMLLGPVRLSPCRGWLQNFQAIETNSLIAATAGSAGIGLPSMANGANMALHRTVLSHDDALKPAFASGDDMFRLESVLKRYGSGAVGMVMFPGAMVTTGPAIGLKAFLAQRLRWVSKSKGYRRPEIIIPAFVVFVFNALLAAMLLLSAFYPLMLLAYLTFVLLKTLTDLPLVWPTFQMAGQKHLIPWMAVFQLFYPPYVLVAALAGLWLPVEWKSRKLDAQT